MENISPPQNVETGKSKFAQQVRARSGVNFNLCYQCLTCSLGCPVSFAMDYLPNQIVRMIQLGARTDVLQSKTIWRCASCETCVTRCPNEINLPRIMDILRQMAIKEKVELGDTGIPAFHEVFLNGIKQWGRQYELGMLLAFKLRVKDFFSDLGLGIKMVQKRKLSLLPRRIKGHKEIAAIFRKLK